MNYYQIFFVAQQTRITTQAVSYSPMLPISTPSEYATLMLAS